MTESDTKGAGAYRWYVAFLLMLVYAFCLLDRQIVTILASEIKRDLQIGDAELGMLYGTTFAVFYAIFGIALGRLADRMSRTRLLAAGLAGWSIMTALCGFAGSYVQLALARLGVGIGEASANPASYSLLSDYFSKRERARALAIYSSGVTLGLAASFSLGGAIVSAWDRHFVSGTGWLGLHGWQAAFVAVGLPGVLLALLVLNLREPVRGAADGMVMVQKPATDSGLWQEFASVVPPFTVWHLVVLRISRREWWRHVLMALMVALAAWGLAVFSNAMTPADKLRILFHAGSWAITSNDLQWLVMGISAYAVLSWLQSLRLRDAEAHRMIARSSAFTPLLIAIALQMLMNYGTLSWAPMYAVQTYGISLREIGVKLGGASLLAGLLGTNLGGVLSDVIRQYTPRGRLYVVLLSITATVPLVFWFMAAPDINQYVFRYGVLGICSTIWLSSAASLTQELVLPRLRGVSAAVLALAMTLVGLGVGPYLSGLISDATGSLRLGMLSMLVVTPVVIGLVLVSMRHVERVEQSLQAGT